MTHRDEIPPGATPNGADVEPELVEVAQAAPRRRVHPEPAPIFGSNPTLHDALHAIRNVAVSVHHNTKALVEELDDVRAQARVDSRNVIDSMSLLLREMQRVHDRLDAIEKRLPQPIP